MSSIIGENQLVIAKLFKATFSTPNGKKCLAHLKKTFVDRPIYRQGSTFEETTYREGEASVIRKILGEVNGR